MGWFKEGVSWAHFVTYLRETVDELKKGLSSHTRDLDTLRTQNIMLLERLTHYAQAVDRLERRLDGVEATLRTHQAAPMIVENVKQAPPKLPASGSEPTDA